jgi:site-specific DNA-methyltransferase (adenine-specific)
LNIDGSRIEAGSEYTALNVTQGGDHFSVGSTRKTRGTKFKPASGRFPSNFIHDGSPEAVAPLQGNQRFFYCAKADQSDRDAGLSKAISTGPERSNRDDIDNPYIGTRSPARNNHPTVKPLALMKYLCRLVTQPGGVVLDPFMGSGTTGRACLEEGFIFVGMEKDPEYFKLCQQRVTRVQLPLFGGLL